jgi:hypothetical protein
VTSLKFFEGGTNMPPYSERKYETKFFKSDPRSIYWELNLSHPQMGERIGFSIDVVCYRPNNTINRYTANSFLEADWTSSYHSNNSCSNTLGQWSAGGYRVDINIEGQKIATESFEILPSKLPQNPRQELKVETKNQQAIQSPFTEPNAITTPSPEKTQTEIAQAPTIPIHKQGDTYTLESTILDSNKRTTTERKVIFVNSEKLVTESRNIENKNGQVRKLEFTPEWNLTTIRNIDGSEVNYSPPLKYYDFPLTSGKTWRQTSTATNRKTGEIKEHTLSAVVGDWENVTVPAGTFRGIKVTIQTELFDRTTGKKTTGTDTSWYVPEVRRSVRSLTSAKSPEGVESKQEIQLIKYDLIK